MAAQTGLCLAWSETPEDTSCRVVAQLFCFFTGSGAYEYDNKFFKYEGQWKNGKKHGKFY